MKQGGVSWNNSPNRKIGIESNFKCDLCGRKYKMLWAKANHEKLCKEFNEAYRKKYKEKGKKQDEQEKIKEKEKTR